MINLQEQWDKCRQFLKDNSSPAQYTTWFHDIKALSFDDATHRLTLGVESDFFVDQLEERFQQVIRSAVTKYFGDNVSIFYAFPVVKDDPSATTVIRTQELSPAITAGTHVPPANPFAGKAEKDFDTQLNPKYTFENYCVSDSNKIARTIGEAIGNDPSIKTFNPLFVFGPPGVGKTHLIQAIGIRIKERNPRAKVLYVTARLFQSQYTAAEHNNNVNNFFHFYQGIDTLIVDDIQDLGGNKAKTQNTFFHIFNHLHQHNKQIIMSSDRSPAEMDGFDERMLSRFKWGMQVELERPDISLRRDVLRLKTEQDGIVIPAEVAEYIASNVTASVRELEGVLVSLMTHATVLNHDINLELTRRVVANAVKINRRQVNFEMIAEEVCSHFNIATDLLYTKVRTRQVADARQVLMYLAKKLAKMPLTTIGHKIDRSHATVIHACNTIEDRLATEKKLAADIEAIEAAIQSR